MSTQPDQESGGPVAVVNLLKFKERAEYSAGDPEAAERISGREAYLRYVEAFQVLIAEEGGFTVFLGATQSHGCGSPVSQGEQFTPAAEGWDAVWINHFPARAVLDRAVADPRYSDMARHRRAGLERQDVLLTKPSIPGPT